MSSPLEHALGYADRGWHVFPCHSPADSPTGCDCRRDSCTSPAKHPRTLRGLNDACDRPAQIDLWWDRWPQANVAIATGPSYLVVLDIDPRHGGDESLVELEAVFGRLPKTMAVVTGGGGTHYYFHGQAKSVNGIMPGVDRKSVGGYVLAPPSVHASGGLYRWWSLEAVPEIAYAPSWLLEAGGRSPDLTAPPISSNISPGARNNTMISLAGSMRRRGLPERVIAKALLVVNEECCDPPLPEAEINRIAWSASRYDPESRDRPSNIQVRRDQ